MKDKNEITQNLGTALKYYRMKNGLSLSELEAVSNVSKSYISRIESGERRSPSITLLHQIAKGLQIPIESLLDITQPSTGKLLPSFAELILANDFIINHKPVKVEVKRNIIELFESIIETEVEDKNKMIYEILDKVDDLKCAL